MGGDPRAMFTCSQWLQKGLLKDNKPSKEDKEEAFKYQLESAEIGYPPAMYNLAFLYLEGQTVEQDAQKAAEWWEKASNRGIYIIMLPCKINP